jgi:1-acyl-sn-glycerol-3-phosphate acyltransferase
MSQTSTEETAVSAIAKPNQHVWRRRIIRGIIRQVGFRFFAKMELTGLENIPPEGRAILMMNHISLLDPIACAGAVTSRFIVPMSKIENKKLPVFNWLFRAWGVYWIDRDNVDRQALMNSIKLVESDQMILMAPEGTRHPEGLAEGKDGMTYVAIKTGAVILPTTISGNVDFKRQWTHLRRCQVRVNFGRPFRFKTGGRKRIPRKELALMTQEAMYQLSLAQPDEALRGVYSDVSQATTETLEFVDPITLEPVE